jgi:hypothetical protein
VPAPTATPLIAETTGFSQLMIVGSVVLGRPVHGDEQHAVVPALESELLVLGELHGLLPGFSSS